MKKTKNLLYVLLLCLIAFVMGYFAFSCSNFNNANISKDIFENTIYYADNHSDYLSFKIFYNALFYIDGDFYESSSFDYEDNLFQFTIEDEIILVAVIDEDTVYCSNYNLYFYKDLR